MFRKTFVLFSSLVSVLCACPTQAASGEVEFETLLEATDCASKSQETVMEMKVLGRSFPLPAGYNFYGLDLGEAVFGLDPDPDPVKVSGDSNGHDPGATIDSVKRKAAQSADVYYSSDRDQPNGPPGFKVIAWQGLTVYYKAQQGGHAVQDIVHQAVIYATEGTGRLSFTAGSPQLIADIVACVKE